MSNMSALNVAFKEWAVICRALAEGRQAIILRKGGISENNGTVRVEHERFWLYPTFVHQQESGIIPSAQALLAEASADRPEAGTIRLTHFAEVASVHHIDDLQRAQLLAPLHLWSPQTVEARFNYRTPGLFVLAVRVYRAATAHVLPETPQYAGCKSWVELGRDLDSSHAVAVMGDDAFAAVTAALDEIRQ